MGAASLLEGFAGVGPVEGMGHGRVVVGDELSELGFEFGHRGEIPAAQAFSVHPERAYFFQVTPQQSATSRIF
jgi:hypothetical protein